MNGAQMIAVSLRLPRSDLARQESTGKLLEEFQRLANGVAAVTSHQILGSKQSGDGDRCWCRALRVSIGCGIHGALDLRDQRQAGADPSCGKVFANDRWSCVRAQLMKSLANPGGFTFALRRHRRFSGSGWDRRKYKDRSGGIKRIAHKFYAKHLTRDQSCSTDLPKVALRC